MSEIRYIDSDKDTHFAGAIAQNAMEVESLDFPSDWADISLYSIIIESITIQSDQNLEWDVYLWTDGAVDETDLDTDKFLDYFNFPASSGKQVAGANQFYYAAPSNQMNIPYYDSDKASKLHVGLVNKSASSKNAGATGEVKLRFAVRPVIGG